MCNAGCLPLYRLAGVFVSSLLYFVSFGIDSCNWVVTDEFNWGLWKRCNTTGVQPVNSELNPVDQPGYYNAVRTLSCFALVNYVLLFFTFDLKKGLGEGLKPVGLCSGIVTLVTIVLVLVGGFYEDDERWRDVSPKLGWCFYMCLASDVLVFLTAFVMFFQYRQHKKLNCKTKVAPKGGPKTKQKQKKAGGQQKKAGGQQKKAGGQQTSPPKDAGPKYGPKTPEEEKKMKKKEVEEEPKSSETLVLINVKTPKDNPPNPPVPELQGKTSDPQPPPHPPPPQGQKSDDVSVAIADSSSTSTGKEDQNQGQRKRATSAEASVCLDMEPPRQYDLEPYHIPDMPGEDHAATAVPDYQLAAGEGREDAPPTPAVAIPSSSVWNRSKKAVKNSFVFLKDYAKTAVGKKSDAGGGGQT